MSSLKIEGRMRRPEYAAAATEYYRALIDGESVSLARLSRVYNRGDYTRGYLAGQDKNIEAKEAALCIIEVRKNS